MFAALIADLGLMVLSAVLNAGSPSVLMMIVIASAVPLLAIATVGVIDRRARRHDGLALIRRIADSFNHNSGFVQSARPARMRDCNR